METYYHNVDYHSDDVFDQNFVKAMQVNQVY
jgi:hypothetical protein